MKSNIFEHNTSFYKQYRGNAIESNNGEQLRGTAIETKMAIMAIYKMAIYIMGALEEKIFKDCDKTLSHGGDT